jgi:glycosyltransferase involved in cell wall biosynthesis
MMRRCVEKKCTAVMACKNADPYVVDSLSSFISQAHKNLNMIVVDDASSDLSAEKILDFIKLHGVEDRIKLIRLTVSLGCAGARNVGIRHANGDYVAVWDSDDIYMENRISNTIDFMEYSCIDACGTWANLMNNFEYTQDKYVYAPCDHDEIVWRLPSKLNPMIDPSCIIRKKCLDVLRGWSEDDNIRLSPDLDLWFRMAKANMRLGNIGDFLMWYRIRPTSNTGSKKDEMIKHHVEVVRRHYGKVELKRHESIYKG